MICRMQSKGSSCGKMAKALLHYGSGLLELAERNGALFEQVDQVYVVKEQCFHCFIDLNVSLEEDIEEAVKFTKSFDKTAMKHIYFQQGCGNKYHSKLRIMF